MRAGSEEYVGCGELAADGATVTPLRPCAATNQHRRLFERAVQYACDFRDCVADRAPRPVMSAHELQALFEGPTPEVGEEALLVIEKLNAAAGPGLTASAGPRFFGWVIGGYTDRM